MSSACKQRQEAGAPSTLRLVRRATLFALLSAAPAICFAALEVDALLAALARPAPASTPFVEVKFSRLLDQPIVVKGELEYLEGGVLARTVTVPFHERTEIHGRTVNVEREGKAPRRFSLERAPELRSMLGSFAAVLGGGRTALERDFGLALKGDQKHWRLTLTPKSAQVTRHVRDIVIQGSGGDPRCISVTQPDESGSIMLVGEAAGTKLPVPLDRAWLDRFCDSAES